MGYHKEKALLNAEEAGDSYFLKYLIDTEIIDGVAAGIGMQVIGRGWRTLTAKQEYVLRAAIKYRVGDLECEMCGDRILTQDAVNGYGEISTRCQSCEYDYQKFWCD